MPLVQPVLSRDPPIQKCLTGLSLASDSQGRVSWLISGDGYLLVLHSVRNRVTAPREKRHKPTSVLDSDVDSDEFVRRAKSTDAQSREYLFLALMWIVTSVRRLGGL